MEWTDEGIVLGVRRHGESSAIVELLTRGHGRHLGLVRGGSGSRMRPLLQVIGDNGLQLDSAIEVVSCALTAAGLYFSFTGDAKGWFNT